MRRQPALYSLIDDVIELLCERLHDVVEFNEASCLKFNIRSFQVFANEFAQVVSCPNSLAD